jgi:hypothetical protein
VLDSDGLVALRTKLGLEFPRAEILAVSIRENRGVEEWFTRLDSGEQRPRATMDLDYEIYTEGEALLGWLNATAQFSSSSSFDAEPVLRSLAREIQTRLAGAEIAHLKMTLSPDDGLGDVAVINLVRSDFVPELSLKLEAPVKCGQLIINCRAEAAPELLRDAVRSAVSRLSTTFEGLSAQLEHLEYFRPGKPTPTHRVTDLAPAQA